ncbi:MAG: glycosyltransferase family 2 protein [Elusimicrobia bacterium]|nr:glycosyltransferase family 2 protein [Elusimicrobiota bacterium]
MQRFCYHWTLPRYSPDFCDSLPPFDRGVSCLCWAYNEEKLIAGFLRRMNDLLRRTVHDYEIVVVDDGSTDRTNEIVRGLAAEIPRIRLIRNPVNLNVGHSSRKAIQNASKEFLFWQTIDWSYDITYLRIFLEFLRTHDVVAGVRRSPVTVSGPLAKPTAALMRLFGARHITRRSDTVPKALVSIINYVLVRILFRVPLSDYQNVVFYRTKLLQSISFEATSSFANPEGLIKAYWMGAKVKEVPISFIPRTEGTAKGTRPAAIFAAAKDVLLCWFRWVILRRAPFVRYGRIDRLAPEEWEQGVHE